MPASFKPSTAAQIRYPDTGGFYRLSEDDFNRFPCVCDLECVKHCDGECGCFACRIAGVDRRSAQALNPLHGGPLGVK